MTTKSSGDFYLRARPKLVRLRIASSRMCHTKTLRAIQATQTQEPHIGNQRRVQWQT